MAETYRYSSTKNGRWPISAGSSAIHVYDQILSYLRDQPNSKEKALPSEYELIHYFGVHRNALRSALRQLDKAGLVERRRGKGTFWNRTPHSYRLLAGSGLSQGLSKDWKSDITRQVISNQMIESAPYLAEEFCIRVGTPLRMVERLTLLGNEPLGIWSFYLPESIAQTLSEEDFYSDADTFIKKSVDHQEVKVSFFISAESADDETTQTLEIMPGSQLLHIERRCVDDLGKMLMIGYGRMRSDRLVLVAERGEISF